MTGVLRYGRGRRRRRHEHDGTERNRLHCSDTGHVMARLTKARSRQAYLLLIMKRDAFAHDPVYLAGHHVVPDSEIEFLRYGARHGDHRHLAFPGLAKPSLLRKLLYPAGALTRGVVPVECHPEVAEDHDRYTDENSDNPHSTSSPLTLLQL